MTGLIAIGLSLFAMLTFARSRNAVMMAISVAVAGFCVYLQVQGEPNIARSAAIPLAAVMAVWGMINAA